MRLAIDLMDIVQVRETFHPLHVLARPGDRSINKFPDKIIYNIILCGKANKDKYYALSANLDPSPDILHIIVGGVIHPFDQQSIMEGIQTHSHGGYIAIREGRIRLKKTFPAGRRVEDETVSGWVCLRAVIKAFRIIKKDKSIKSLIIYVCPQHIKYLRYGQHLV
jgi:hypothetical protein